MRITTLETVHNYQKIIKKTLGSIIENLHKTHCCAFVAQYRERSYNNKLSILSIF